MTRSPFRYIRPTDLDEALAFLAEHGPKTGVLAGGSDFSIKARSGDFSGEFALDISRLPELRVIGVSEDSITIGSAATFSELIANARVPENAPVLAKAVSTIGSLQIRNVGTIGGNAANASPAADSVPALMVHDTWVRIKSSRAERVEPLADFIVAPYKTTLKSDEIITAFVLKKFSDDYRSSFHRIARRKSLSIARINCAALAKCADDGTVEDLGLSLGSITPQPCRMTHAEEFIKGKHPSLDVIVRAAELVSAEMVRLSGVRSSTEYKKPAAEGLVIKCLMEVFGLND